MRETFGQKEDAARDEVCTVRSAMEDVARHLAQMLAQAGRLAQGLAEAPYLQEMTGDGAARGIDAGTGGEGSAAELSGGGEASAGIGMAQQALHLQAVVRSLKKRGRARKSRAGRAAEIP